LKVFESFRDPQGKVVLTDREVWRLVRPEETVRLAEFLDLKLTNRWQENGKLIPTAAAAEEEIRSFDKKFKDFRAGSGAAVGAAFDLFKHRRIEFPSFPYEWAPEMLHDAGRLTLEAAESFFAETGWSLKDATPFNVLFDGAAPVFIDVLSFEKRAAKDPIWLPYNQFVQTFLLPLLVNRETGLSLQTIFLANREGLPVAEAGKFFSKIKKIKPEVLSLVTLPNLLSRRAESDAALYQPKNLDSAEKAEFVLKQSFRRLGRQLERVLPADSARRSSWTGYTSFNQETIPEYMQAKQSFVSSAIDELKPKSVLDVGANTGFFSFLAARNGAQVVAIDYDAAVVGEIYRTAKKEKLNVLPLVLSLSRPTPALGWRYSENPSFLDRAVGRFDLLMMLAVVHHMLVQERIPLREILRLAADLTKDALLIEFVPPADKLFKRLARGREHLHQDLTTEKFLQTAAEFFLVSDSRPLPETERQLFLMRKK
jgi:SAM-dependent methyltransferase